MLAVVPGRELACRHAIKTTCDNFQKSDCGLKIASVAQAVHGDFEDSLKRLKLSQSSGSPYKATWCEQFRAVLWRSWLSVIKEPILIKVRLLQTIVRFPPTIADVISPRWAKEDNVCNLCRRWFRCWSVLSTSANEWTRTAWWISTAPCSSSSPTWLSRTSLRLLTWGERKKYRMQIEAV